MWCKAAIAGGNDYIPPTTQAIALLAKRSVSKGIIRDIALIGVGVLVVWLALSLAFGTQNPFYIVASGSMVPALDVNDVLVVQGHEPFEDIRMGDIIVFDRPSDHNRVIVHRVVSVISDEPRAIKTKGDANPASIPGTDFPITEEEYIGKVVYVIPQIGYVTQLLKPPINYIIIAVVIGIMIIKQLAWWRRGGQGAPPAPQDPPDGHGGPDTAGSPPGADRVAGDGQHAGHDVRERIPREPEDGAAGAEEKEQKAGRDGSGRPDGPDRRVHIMPPHEWQ